MLVVMIGWVLFRSPDLKYALSYLGVMFGVVGTEKVGFTVGWYLTKRASCIIIISCIAALPLKKIFVNQFKAIEGTYIELVGKNVFIILLLCISVIMVMTSTYNPFIYFRF